MLVSISIKIKFEYYFLFQGHDTTAAAISWCLFMLGNHPKIQVNIPNNLFTLISNIK